MAGNRKQRLGKVETALTPQQAVRQWLREAHQYHSLTAYVAYLKTQPLAKYPLPRLSQQVTDAAFAGHQGRSAKDAQATRQAVDQAEKDVTFLFKLTSVAGEVWHEHERPLALGIMLLAEQFGRLSDARSRAFDAAEARHKLCQRLPYPLDHDTARAVEAALRHRVVTWAQFEEDGCLQDWVDGAYEHEGKQRLPFLSSLLQKGEQAASSAPDREEVKACFAGEAAFEQFLAGEEYSYGLADVPDAAFEARYDLVDEGIRDLVTSRKVRVGRAVYLETVLTPLLRDAPLVDGRWLDAYVVELAEWGALLLRQGYVFDDPGDESPFAPERVGRWVEGGWAAVEQGVLDAARREARKRLARCKGERREIEGRSYLRLEDYAAWRGRATKDAPEAADGFVASSWNAWVRAQRKAAVAGVSLEAVTTWGEASRYVALDAAVVAHELTERSALLAQLDGLSLHDDDQQQGAFKKAGTLGARSYAQAAARWRATFETFWYEACWIEGAIAATARRYLGGEPLLFPEDTEALDRTLRSLRALGNLFNEPPLQQLIATDAAVALGDNDALTELIADRSAYLVDRAKAETLHLWEDDDRAATLMERWV